MKPVKYSSLFRDHLRHYKLDDFSVHYHWLSLSARNQYPKTALEIIASSKKTDFDPTRTRKGKIESLLEKNIRRFLKPHENLILTDRNLHYDGYTIDLCALTQKHMYIYRISPKSSSRINRERQMLRDFRDYVFDKFGFNPYVFIVTYAKKKIDVKEI